MRLAHLRANGPDGLAAEGRHAPRAAASGDAEDEILDERRAARRVRDFGMELHAVEPALVVGDGGVRRICAHGHRAEAFGQCGHAVAVAHPHGLFVAHGKEAVEQAAGAHDLDLGPAVFARFGGLDRAAEGRHHGLLAIADAEHGNARIEQRARHARAFLRCHARGAAGENDGLGPRALHRGRRVSARRNLAIDADLAHAARNELSELAPEIDDQDALGQLAGLVVL